MAVNMKVLYVCTELFPFLKTGGLADVTAGLTQALQAGGCDVRLLIAGLPAIAADALGETFVARLPDGPAPWGRAPDLPAADLMQAMLPGYAVPIYLLRAPALFDRPGNPYQGPDGRDWPDNAQRFAALGWAAATLGQGLDPSWRPDIIHCHDWHAGLAPAYVRAFSASGQATPATVFSIHNLAYQGVFPRSAFSSLGLPQACFSIEGLEFFDNVSFMKAGIQYADRITTVSPTYAKEILTPEQGCGLDGVLRERAPHLVGILNGVDPHVWNPGADPWLASPYDVDSLHKKRAIKRALQNRFGLEPRASALVFGVVSRITEQKGLHLLPQLLGDLVQRGGQLALLGQGSDALERALCEAQSHYPGQVGVHIGYDEMMAHEVVAGADVLLMPSMFEPCGLTQLYALRYGTLPLVRRVGGLADTVVDCSLDTMSDDTATGFVFDEPSDAALLGAVHRAFALAQQPTLWTAVQQRGMRLRFDWAAAARQYVSLFLSLRDDAVQRRALRTQGVYHVS
jgi:starch synthase